MSPDPLPALAAWLAGKEPPEGEIRLGPHRVVVDGAKCWAWLKARLDEGVKGQTRIGVIVTLRKLQEVLGG